MRTATRLLFATLLVALLGFAAAEVRIRHFRRRAEVLLADIKALQVRQSTWADAQRFMTRWGRDGAYYGSCSSDDCGYSVRCDDDLWNGPGFVYDKNSRRVARLLEWAGLRASAVSASFEVLHGVVVSKRFRIEVALPAKQWIDPQGTYIGELAGGFSENATLRGAVRFPRPEHPNHHVGQVRIYLQASFTPEESMEKQKELTEVLFNCVTSFHPCTDRAELQPGAEREYREERNQPDEDGNMAACLPTVQLRAREAQDVLLVEVFGAALQPASESFGYRQDGYWQFRFRVDQVLKGKAQPGETLTVEYRTENARDTETGHKVLLMGRLEREWQRTDSPRFSPSPCGLAEVTPENQYASQQGIREDFGPRF
jgi:hypothetical protein